MLTKLRDMKLLVPALMVAVALPFLIGLGIWQMQRMAWKEGVIADITARTAAEPIDLKVAVASARPAADLEYTRVRVTGRFLHDKERYFYAPDPAFGPGFNVYTPLEISGQTGVVFVNRGYVPERLRETAARREGQVEGDVEIIGLIRAPGGKGSFTPDNDPAGNLWFWRDLPALALSAFGEPGRAVVPFVVDAEGAAPGGAPKGGATLLNLPNRHFEYALTWFGLAATLAAIFAAYVASRFKADVVNPQ
jgi:surfeit locus 1 family protein